MAQTLQNIEYSQRVEPSNGIVVKLPLKPYNFYIDMVIPKDTKTIILKPSGWCLAYDKHFEYEKDGSLAIDVNNVYCGAVYDYWETTTYAYKVVDGELIPYEQYDFQKHR